MLQQIENQKDNRYRKNPNVHVLLGREGKKLDEDYIEVEGLASIEEDSTLKTSFGIIA